MQIQDEERVLTAAISARAKAKLRAREAALRFIEAKLRAQEAHLRLSEAKLRHAHLRLEKTAFQD